MWKCVWCVVLTFFSWKCSGRNVSGISCSGLTICGWTCCRKPSSTPLNVNFFILFIWFDFVFYFRILVFLPFFSSLCILLNGQNFLWVCSRYLYLFDFKLYFPFFCVIWFKKSLFWKIKWNESFCFSCVWRSFCCGNAIVVGENGIQLIIGVVNWNYVWFFRFIPFCFGFQFNCDRGVFTICFNWFKFGSKVVRNECHKLTEHVNQKKICWTQQKTQY